MSAKKEEQAAVDYSNMSRAELVALCTAGGPKREKGAEPKSFNGGLITHKVEKRGGRWVLVSTMELDKPYTKSGPQRGGWFEFMRGETGQGEASPRAKSDKITLPEKAAEELGIITGAIRVQLAVKEVKPKA